MPTVRKLTFIGREHSLLARCLRSLFPSLVFGEQFPLNLRILIGAILSLPVLIGSNPVDDPGCGAFGAATHRLRPEIQS